MLHEAPIKVRLYVSITTGTLIRIRNTPRSKIQEFQYSRVEFNIKETDAAQKFHYNYVRQFGKIAKNTRCLKFREWSIS